MYSNIRMMQTFIYFSDFVLTLMVTNKNVRVWLADQFFSFFSEAIKIREISFKMKTQLIVVLLLSICVGLALTAVDQEGI